MHRVVTERLGIVPDQISAGHCVALSRPKDLASMLAGYVTPTSAAISATRAATAT